MKSKLLLILFVIVSGFAASCNKETKLSDQNLIWSDFEMRLKPGMNYYSIVSEFGEPDSDIGSGIHIYVYILDDSTEAWIGYTDKILYARHMDKNHQLLETLI
jgi:hypothetical protein